MLAEPLAGRLSPLPSRTDPADLIRQQNEAAIAASRRPDPPGPTDDRPLPARPGTEAAVRAGMDPPGRPLPPPDAAAGYRAARRAAAPG
ncbi:hypothetical protein [Histidinibacterium lentulum]|uniref:Uncharacterized protein n=1 Tax=Histidinibacterium lentulum TaxID=2480588 RepID=A0A3N2QTE5_9RHOB|nr:hypothetical protein [Histidinibacterium lentulum]ROT98487.1 hypothetical protein EAT49_16220 [Histidinibacterium lentulum]